MRLTPYSSLEFFTFFDVKKSGVVFHLWGKISVYLDYIISVDSSFVHYCSHMVGIVLYGLNPRELPERYGYVIRFAGVFSACKQDVLNYGFILENPSSYVCYYPHFYIRVDFSRMAVYAIYEQTHLGVM